MTLAEFVASAIPPVEGRHAAARALLDTIGVMLAGASESAAASVQQVVAQESSGLQCSVLGTGLRTSATNAALANGTAAHAHDTTTCASSRLPIPARRSSLRASPSRNVPAQP